MKTLKLFFTSDLHGFFLPTDFRDRAHKPMGLSCLLTQMDRDENSLLIDGGDTTQGSPLTYFANSRSMASPAIAAMNAAGYDYYTLGNHDFNYGRQALAAYVQGVRAQCLCANVRDARGEIVPKPYALRVMPNGLRVGLVGLTTDFINLWERPENIVDLAIGDPMAAACEAVQALRTQCDVLVGVYHGGFEKALDTGAVLSKSTENIACALCEALPLDVLLTGHQHMPLEGACYAGTWVVQPPANGGAFARVQIDVESDGRVRVHSRLIKAGAEADARVRTPIAQLNEAAQRWLDAPVGHLDRPLMPGEHAQMAAHSCDIANFFNMVQLDATGAQLSCTCLGNDVKGFVRDVTVRDVVSTYIYPNTLAVLRVTGAQLKEALERAASYLERDADGTLRVADAFLRPKVEHYNYDYFAGLGYTFDLSKPVGRRVTRMEFEGKPMDMDAHYTLCMNNYRATGAGGYEVYARCEKIGEGTQEISELIIAYLERHREITVPNADFGVL